MLNIKNSFLYCMSTQLCRLLYKRISNGDSFGNAMNNICNWWICGLYDRNKSKTPSGIVFQTTLGEVTRKQLYAAMESFFISHAWKILSCFSEGLCLTTTSWRLWSPTRLTTSTSATYLLCEYPGVWHGDASFNLKTADLGRLVGGGVEQSFSQLVRQSVS